MQLRVAVVSLALSLLLLLLFTLAVYNEGGVDELAYRLFPYIPSTYFQAFGSWYVRLYTCHMLPTVRLLHLALGGNIMPSAAVKCSNEPDALYVVVTAAKGGTVLAARAAIDIAAACGKCGAIGYRPHGKWPPAQESMPTYRGDVLLAIANAQTWPMYAREHGGPVRCAVFTRDPATRFSSLFQYVLDGSEYDLAEPSRTLKSFLPDYVKAVEWMWKSIGRETMIESHRVLTISLARKDCQQIKFETFANDFDGAAKQWADAWGILPNATETVVKSIQRHDVKRKSRESLAKEHHISGTKMSERDKAAMNSAIKEHGELQKLLNSQRRELGYA